MFSENEINELSFHKNSFDHIIDFLLKKNSFCDSIYNLSKNELTVLKIYINKNLINEFIVRSKFSANVLILFTKKKRKVQIVRRL